MLTTIAAAAPAVWHGPGFGFGFFPFFLLIPLLWIAVIVVLFGIFGRRWRRRAMAGDASGFGPAWSGGSRRAELTLAERFAQGDIDEQEYRARLEVLRANRG